MPGQLGTYGFINAKVRSRLGQLLPEETFQSLLKFSTLEEVIATLKNTEYARHLDLYATTGDVRAVEFALFAHEIDTVMELLKYLKHEPADFVRALVYRYEVDMVKNALRFWFDRSIRKRSSNTTASYLYQQQLVHDVDLDGIVNAQDEDQLLQVVEGTPYFEVIRRNLSVMQSEKQIFSLELDLDGLFYQNLFDQIQKLSKKDREIASRIIGVEVDLQNIDRIVRFVSFYEKDTRRRFHLFLPGGSIKQDVLQEAYFQDGAEEALKVLLDKSYTRYKTFTGEHHSNPFTRLNLVEGLLRNILQDEVKRLLRGYPFTIGTVIAYIFLKRKEISSLIRVINAKYYGLSEERIREIL